MDHRETDQPDQTAAPSPTPRQMPRTPAEWRAALREMDDLPERLAALPRRQRRRAAKRWRSAVRAERVEALRRERRRTPTGLVVPIVALLIAGAVAVGAFLTEPEEPASRVRATPTTSAPEPAGTAPSPSSSPSSSASASAAAALTNPEDVAEAFTRAYSTRRPLQDGSHEASVQRAALYASEGLVDNLTEHADQDFDKLVAGQALEAKPAKVTISNPAGAKRPAPDTEVRIWREATVQVKVTATEDYSYTRELLLEVARADLDQPWMVTRVLGLKG